jgi:hypothetical protein
LKIEQLTLSQSVSNGAAVFVPDVGVIACAGRMDEADVVKVDCYVIDAEKPHFGPLLMDTLRLENAGNKSADVATKVKLVVSEKKILYLYSNAQNHIYKGVLNVTKCDPKLRCLSYAVAWQKVAADIDNAPFGNLKLDRDPCMVYFDGAVYLLGGLSSEGATLRTALRMDLLQDTFELSFDLIVTHAYVVCPGSC